MNPLDPYRAAKLLLDLHGPQETWRILMARAIKEHAANDQASLVITLKVQEAMRVLLLDTPESGEPVQ